MTNTAVYRRVSTDRQDSSLATQETRIDDYLRFKGLDASGETTFYDEATSGSVPLRERPGGQRLFNTLRHSPGVIQHLVVAKLDRLGRSAADPPCYHPLH